MAELKDLKELRVLNIGGVDYNVGFSANDLTDALKQAYDKAVVDSGNALTAFEGLKLVQITENLDANVREAFELHDNGGNKLGDATIKIYKDSALQEVELVDQKMTFTYLLADGTTKTEEVDLSLFLAQAEFKNGLAVNENGEVNVVLGATNETNKNFLEFEGTDGSQVLAVRDMDADVTVTTEAIPVAGGPLAKMYADAGLGSEIAAGTDLQALLFSLFCKEIYPTISETPASLVSKVATPTITLGNTSTVEVGTEVSVKIENGESSYTATPHKVTGMTNGYSADDDDTQDSANTSIQASFGTISISGNDKTTLTYTMNGASHTEEGTSAAKSAVVETTAVAIEGNYTITAKATSVAYTGVCSKLDSVYYCSNLKKTDASKVTTARTEVTKTSSVVNSTQASKNVVGAYKYYIGYATAVPNSKEAILAINKFDNWSANNGFITKDTGNTISTGGTLPGGNNMIIAVPVDYKLSDIRNGMDLESIGSFATTQVDYALANEKHVGYNVYAFKSGSDWNFGKIVITKA